jgi:predicted aldo/keto reductase-like oxidoreductase
MVDAFLAGGFRYFDTAYVYNAGTSETAIRDALTTRHPRESFLLADKLPYWLAQSYADLEPLLDTSLERCGVDYFDFYLIHSLDQGGYERCLELGVFKFMEEMKAKGKASHIGFSMHDGADTLEKILSEQPAMEFVQLQVNYIDWENEKIQSRANYETACRHDVPVVIMEPVKGGGLADMNPAIAAPLLERSPDASVASWAFRFLSKLDNVLVMLSGMGTEAQVEDNIATYADLKPLDSDELASLKQVADALNAQETTGCTACGYCLDGCPEQIKIPSFLAILDDFKVYSSRVLCQHAFNVATGAGIGPANCIACGACEDICPQSLPIIDYLAETDELFHNRV